MRKMVKLFGLLGFITLLPLSSIAGGALVVENAWIRMPPPVADTAAVYMRVSNHGKATVNIKSAESKSAEKLSFHSMMMHGDMMHMMEMENVQVAEHGAIVFEPNGNHLMLEGLTVPLKAGDVVEISLTTESGEKYQVQAEVRDLRDATPAHADHSHHH